MPVFGIEEGSNRGAVHAAIWLVNGVCVCVWVTFPIQLFAHHGNGSILLIVDSCLLATFAVITNSNNLFRNNVDG